ncbi:MAG: hypothetical protein Q8P18_04145 [Pseudomonadota bacterium]|nr:hypothetical protein [Pseudomonadota bacterium]
MSASGGDGALPRTSAPGRPAAPLDPRARLARLAASPLVAVAAYFASALALTWPLAADPAHQVAGGVRTDAFNSLWNLWFSHQGLARGALPVYTTLLDPPGGGRIVIADPLNALLGFPFVAAFGEVTAYAILVIGHLWLAGAAAHWLGRRLGGSGWVAGIGFQCAPIVLSHIHNGSSETISAGLLPLAVLAIVSAVERGGIGRIVLAGLALFLVAFSGWYAGVGAFMVAVAVLLFGWEGVPWRAVVARLLPAIVLGLALTVPLAGAVRSVAEAPDGLVDIKNPEELVRIRRTLGGADPRVFVLPGSFRSPDFAAIEGNPSDRVHTAYLGFALLLLAARHGRRRALWVAVLGGIVLALGPVVVINGFPLNVAGRALPLPYAIVEDLPGFSSLSLLYRLATVSALLLAVLADRARPAWALLVLAEVVLVSPARALPGVTTLPDQGAVSVLADRPDGIVMNLPVLAGRNFLFEQTIHEKPVAGSLNSGINRVGLRVVAAGRRLRSGEIDKPAFVEVARAEGVRYVVLHKSMLMDETFVTAWTGIRRAFEPISEDERVVVYQLW